MMMNFSIRLLKKSLNWKLKFVLSGSVSTGFYMAFRYYRDCTFATVMVQFHLLLLWVQINVRACFQAFVHLHLNCSIWQIGCQFRSAAALLCTSFNLEYVFCSYALFLLRDQWMIGLLLWVQINARACFQAFVHLHLNCSIWQIGCQFRSAAALLCTSFNLEYVFCSYALFLLRGQWMIGRLSSESHSGLGTTFCQKNKGGQISPVDYFAVLNFGFLKRIQTPHSLLNFILGFRSR